MLVFKKLGADLFVSLQDSNKSLRAFDWTFVALYGWKKDFALKISPSRGSRS